LEQLLYESQSGYTNALRALGHHVSGSRFGRQLLGETLMHLQIPSSLLDYARSNPSYIAETYGYYVYGIDLSVNMIMLALETAAATGNGQKVPFEVSDAAKR